MKSKHISFLLLGVFLYSSLSFADQQVPAYSPGQSSTTQQKQQLDQKWINAATIQLRTLMNGSAQNIAASIQGVTHPTGTSPMLANFNVLNLGDRMMVQINVAWRGGVLGTAYQTSVNWEFTPDSHLSAKVVGDTAMIAIEPQNLQMLDGYFRQSVWPVFYSNMQNVASQWK